MTRHDPAAMRPAAHVRRGAATAAGCTMRQCTSVCLVALLSMCAALSLSAQSPSDDTTTEPLRVLGLSVVASGGPRDTIGLLVSVVTRDGPADQAGITAGSRILAINGVPVRLAPAEIGRRSAAESAVTRFAQAIRGTPPESDVTLRVAGGGQTRTVAVPQRGRAAARVAAAQAAPTEPQVIPAPTPQASAVAPARAAAPESTPAPPAVSVAPAATPAPAVSPASGAVAPALPPAPAPPVLRTRSDSLHALEEELTDVRKRLRRLYAADSVIAPRDTTRVQVTGIELGRISGDLATFLGPQADSALLVLQASAEWEPARPGDVVLQIDGVVPDAARLRAAIEARRAVSLLLLRRNRTFTVSIAAPVAAP